MTEIDRFQEIGRFSANLDLLINLIQKQEAQKLWLERQQEDAKNLALRILRMDVVENGQRALPESSRENYLEAFTVRGVQRTLVRRHLEGVIAVLSDGARIFEYRADGNVNMIEGGVIIHTTEPYDQPREGYAQRDVWVPHILPNNTVKSFRVRGLV